MQSGGSGAGVQAPVPDGDDEVGVGDGQGAGQVHGVGAAQGMGAGELPGVAFDGCGELDWAYCRPVLFPGVLGGVQVAGAEVVVAAGCGEGGADFGVGQAAGQGGVAASHRSAARSLPSSWTTSLTRALESK